MKDGEDSEACEENKEEVCEADRRGIIFYLWEGRRAFRRRKV
jgi:hypothetical protein